MPQQELNLDEPKPIPVYLGEPVTYTLNQLQEKWHEYMKANRRKEYRAMSPKDRNTTAKLKAGATERYAKNLMESGVPDFQAWPRAISAEIFGKETD